MRTLLYSVFQGEVDGGGMDRKRALGKTERDKCSICKPQGAKEPRGLTENEEGKLRGRKYLPKHWLAC